MSGYGIANATVDVYRGTTTNAYGDEEHRLDPDAVIATRIPVTISGAKKTVLVAQDNWDNTSRTPRNIEPLIVRIASAQNQRVPDGGVRAGDLLLVNTRGEKYAVRTATNPHAVGRQSPDLVFELDRLS